MIDYLIEIDTNVFFWLNSSHTTFWDVVMKMASGKIIWIGLYASLVYALWRAYGWHTAVVTVVGAVLAVALADQITATLLRPYFERLRPANLDNPISPMVHIVDGYRAGRFGFPSSHAANTFALATLMSLIFRRLRFTLFIFMWAFLNCYSRVYLGVHYPGDLLFGIIIGTLFGWFIYIGTMAVIRIWGACRLTGKTDRLRRANVGGIRFTYHPADVPVAVELLTILAIIFCAVSIFF